MPKSKIWNGTQWVALDANNADTVGGKKADSTANNLLVLDGSAKVPAANIPSTVSADTVDGKHADNSANNLLVLDGSAKVPVVNLPKLNQIPVPDAIISLNGQKITNMANPTGASDAATKAYVDAAIQGLDIKDSVEAATTATLNATYSYSAKALNSTTNIAFSIDGVTPAAGTRLLVKNQATALENGIYTVTNAGSSTTPWVLTRASDFNSDANVNAGTFVFVTGGSQNGLTGWVMTAAKDSTVILDTNPINFVQFSGAGAYNAGTGLSRVGNTFSLNPANSATRGGVKIAAGVPVDGSGDTTLAKIAATGDYNDLSNKPLPGKITVSTTAPTSPSTNDIWFDMN